MNLPPDLTRRVLELAGTKPPPVTEKVFMADVLAFARAHSWLCYHTHDSRRSSPGFPDVVMSRGWRLIVAELKAEGGRLTPDQAEWLEAFRAAGIPAYCWRPSSWAEIESVLRSDPSCTTQP